MGIDSAPLEPTSRKIDFFLRSEKGLARDPPVGTADRFRASGPLPNPVSRTYKYEPKAEHYS